MRFMALECFKSSKIKHETASPFVFIELFLAIEACYLQIMKKSFSFIKIHFLISSRAMLLTQPIFSEHFSECDIVLAIPGSKPGEHTALQGGKNFYHIYLDGRPII